MGLPRLLLLTAGHAIEEIAASHGDFDRWFGNAFKDLAALSVVRVCDGEPLPASLEGVDGVVISGSPASVTEWDPWMRATAEFIRRCADVDLPLLGVCFGHQLLGQALGGQVQPNPVGREIGTVDVVLTKDGALDPVLGPLVPGFRIQATHVDSVVDLPPGAVVLAQTTLEKHAAIRVGRNLYGVQFHPEMGAALIKRYISHRAKIIDGERGPGTADRIYANVTETRAGDALLKRFITEVVVPYKASGRGETPRKGNRASRPREQSTYQEHFTVADDGQPVFFNEVGHGTPPLLLCDGVGCDQYAWKYVVEQMKDHHHIIRWNYPGHGRTPPPRGWPQMESNRLAVEGLADDAIKVLDAAGVEKAVLCGHSLGVQVALETWHRHKDRVSALILVCGSYGRPLRTFHGRTTMEHALPAIKAAFNLIPRVTRGIWKRTVDSELAYQVAVRMEVNGALVKRRDFSPYFRHLAQVDPLLFVEMVAHANAHTAEDWLHTVDVPALVVAGEKDTFTPAHLSHRMQAVIPGAEILTVPAGTHTAPIEIPELVTLRMEKFLLERLGKDRRLQNGMAPRGNGLAARA